MVKGWAEALGERIGVRKEPLKQHWGWRDSVQGNQGGCREEGWDSQNPGPPVELAGKGS